MSWLLAAVVLATVVAFPAFAQSYDPSVGSGNVNPGPYRKGQTLQLGASYHARAQARHIESANAVSVERAQRTKTRTP